MTKQSKVRLSVISAMLLLAVGLPVASVVGNAPSHHGTASLEQPAAPSDDVVEMPLDTVRSTTVLAPAITASAPRAARPPPRASGAACGASSRASATAW